MASKQSDLEAAAAATATAGAAAEAAFAAGAGASASGAPNPAPAPKPAPGAAGATPATSGATATTAAVDDPLGPLKQLINNAMTEKTKVDNAFNAATSATASTATWGSFTNILQKGNDALTEAKKKYDEYHTSASSTSSPAAEVTKKYNVIVKDEVKKQYDAFMNLLTFATTSHSRSRDSSLSNVIVTYDNFSERVAEYFNNLEKTSVPLADSDPIKVLQPILQDKGLPIITAPNISNALLNIQNPMSMHQATNEFAKFLAYILFRSSNNSTLEKSLYLYIINKLKYDSILDIISDFLNTNTTEGKQQVAILSPHSSSSTTSTPHIDVNITNLKNFIETINAIFNSTTSRELITGNTTSTTTGGSVYSTHSLSTTSPKNRSMSNSNGKGKRKGKGKNKKHNATKKLNKQ